jgi:hypothetical protein
MRSAFASFRATPPILKLVVQVHDAALESAFVQQLELHPEISGKPVGAASDDDGRDELMELVDQPGSERVRGEPGTADREVAR